MPQEPIENQDNQNSKTTNSKATWSAPKGTGTKDFVKIDVDDLHVERVERLGQYLSDTTVGNMANPDVRGGQGNHFPIFPPGTETPKQFNHQKSADEDANRYFNQLSNQTSFEPGIEEEADGTYGTGHELLQEKAVKVVDTHINKNSVNVNSRWFGVGIERFPPKLEDNLYQVQRSGPYLDSSLDPQADPQVGSRFIDYRHKEGQSNRSIVENSDSGDKTSKFWEEYHDRLSYVGAKITDDSIPGIVDDILTQTIDVESTYPGQVFMDGQNKPESVDQVKLSYRKSILPVKNNKTYGQENSWKTPFIKESVKDWEGKVDVTGVDGNITAKSTMTINKMASSSRKEKEVSPGSFTVFHKSVTYGDAEKNKKKQTDWSKTVNWKNKKSSPDGNLSLTKTPSLFLLPKTTDLTNKNLIDYGLQTNASRKFASMSGANNLKGSSDKKATKGIKKKFQKKEDNRFSPDQVRRIENQLEAEHLPFYIQDLRTNEVISFHAFLTSLSDSYSADWSAQKGFGRIEAAQIYGGGSRSIAVNFLVVPMNEQDFNEMYYKINKLTTLVYPQWSEGTLMQNGESTYVQPFSQVPTASPLCRIRVGDLFTSNYSDVAMARMMGVSNPKFNYVEPSGEGRSQSPVEESDLSIQEQLAQTRYAGREMFKTVWMNASEDYEDYFDDALKLYLEEPESFIATLEGDFMNEISLVFPNSFMNEFGTSGEKFISDESLVNYFLATSRTVAEPSKTPPSTPAASSGISSLFDRSKNPIMKSFNSTMGRGIAVAITGIGLDWKLNSTPWNLEPGNRAPRMCEISLSLTPIHDITPGLDHQGINRAPIYKVGEMSKSLTGDVWENNEEYDKIIAKTKQRPAEY